MKTITERVAAGAAWLDQREPGWPERIDLDRLDLRSSGRDILGQLATGQLDEEAGARIGRWTAILLHFGLTSGTAAEFGFVRRDWEDEAYEALTAEWKRVIAGRWGAS